MQGFALHWMWEGSRGSSVIVRLKKFCPAVGTSLRLNLVKQQLSLRVASMGLLAFVSWTISMFCLCPA